MKSPCLDICIFDGKTGWCIGCGRTLTECRLWKKAKSPVLKSIAKDLPRRMIKLTARAAAGQGEIHDT